MFPFVTRDEIYGTFHLLPGKIPRAKNPTKVSIPSDYMFFQIRTLVNIVWPYIPVSNPMFSFFRGSSLVLTNLSLYYVCRKRSPAPLGLTARTTAKVVAIKGDGGGGGEGTPRRRVQVRE